MHNALLALLVLVGAWVAWAAWACAGHLQTIAALLAMQNIHYGIVAREDAEPPEPSA